MKTIIIDDNQKATNFLKELIQHYCPSLELLGSASNIQEGKTLIEQVMPELVFLDIEMPNGTGFDLLQQLPNLAFKVIFTTAHEKYALKAIKFSALDYLLKPIDLDDLQQAVQKAQEDAKGAFLQTQVQTLLQNLQTPPQEPARIILKDKYGMQVTKLDDIIRLEADNNYTKFVIKNQNALLLSKPLGDYEKILPPRQFFRCHKSHIVNLDYLLRYDKREDEVLMMQDGSKVPVSRRKLDTLLEKMKNSL